MKFAYADPPYIGQARRYWENQEVDHPRIILRLVEEYPDGWALSLSSPTLKTILPLCPSTARVMAWVKPFCSFKPSVRIAYAWEPVIVCGGRPRVREQPTVRDWVSVNATLKRTIVGAKPKEFYWWLLDVFNVEAGDTIHDLYPGTGGFAATCRLRYVTEGTDATILVVSSASGEDRGV